MTDQDQGVPVHEGPDPKDWPEAAPKMWGSVLNIEFLTRIAAALGPWSAGEDERVVGGAREFLQNALRGQREELAQMILHAYKVRLPEEAADLATEAAGGFRGDGNGPGDRDNLRPV